MWPSNGALFPCLEFENASKVLDKEGINISVGKNWWVSEKTCFTAIGWWKKIEDFCNWLWYLCMYVCNDYLSPGKSTTGKAQEVK